MRLFGMSDRKLAAFNVKRAEYQASQKKIEKFISYLRDKQSSLDSHQENLINNISNVIDDMVTEISELEELKENQTVEWYQSATLTLNNLFEGITQPNLQKARSFLDAAYALQRKSCFDSELERKRNSGIFFARVCLCMLVICLIGVAVFLPLASVFICALAAWTFNAIACGSFAALTYKGVSKIDKELEEYSDEFDSHILTLNQVIHDMVMNQDLNLIASNYSVCSDSSHELRDMRM